MSGLTARQRSILEFLRGYVRDRGYPPTIREIRDAFSLRSNRGVSDHLKALERKGFIKRVPGSSRAIEITADIERSGEETRLIGGSGDYVIEVMGDGMNDEHIVPGDLVVVRIVLRPANAKRDSIVLSDADSPECAIVGKVVGVIRSLEPHRGAFSG